MDKLNADERQKIALLQREEKDSTAGISWMYKGNKPNDEEYLLGKSVDKYVDVEGKNKDEASLIFGERIKANIALDMAAKMREDPLFAIRRKEEESKRKLLENPVRMKELQKLIDRRQKLKKKKTKKKHKKSRSSDDCDDDDDIMKKYLSILSSKHEGGEKHKSAGSDHEREGRKKKKCVSDARSHESIRDWNREGYHGLSSRESDLRNVEKEQRMDIRTKSFDPSSKIHNRIKEKYVNVANRHNSVEYKMTSRKKDSEGRNKISYESKTKDRNKRYREERSPVDSQEKTYNLKLEEKSKKQRQAISEMCNISEAESMTFDNRTSYVDHIDKKESKRTARSSSSSSSSSSLSSPIRHVADHKNDKHPGLSSPGLRKSGLHQRSSHQLALLKQQRSSSTSLSSPKLASRTADLMTKQPERLPSLPVKKFTDEEKQKRLAEMTQNAKWREEQRQMNVERYSKEEQEKEKKDKDCQKGIGFLSSLMVDHASSSSVEDRIQRNKYNIQRSKVELNKHFTKK